MGWIFEHWGWRGMTLAILGLLALMATIAMLSWRQAPVELRNGNRLSPHPGT
jgi:hypothetical protein